MPNLHDPDFDEIRHDREGFHARRVRLGRQAGAVRLGASVFEVEPGQAAYPYHAHLAEEELLFFLDAGFRLRTPDGWRDVERGEVLSFEPGDAGAHQVVNAGDAPARFLAISTAGAPDIVVQPDSGKIGAFERRPDGGGIREWYRRADQVGYYEGEEPPAHGGS